MFEFLGFRWRLMLSFNQNTFSLFVNVSNYGVSDLTVGNVFFPSPKHMIRLPVDYRQDLKILIRLWIKQWKSNVGDTPTKIHNRF